MPLWAWAAFLAVICVIVGILRTPSFYASSLQNSAWNLAQGITVIFVFYTLLWYAALWLVTLLI